MPLKPFTGSFTQQEALGEDVIAAAISVLTSGRLHRYNTVAGEPSKASELEQAYAAYQGARYCLACASGGYAMAIALRAAGLGQGETVLTNGFTLAPVPGAIASAGGKPVLVEITADLVIDLEDLDRKARSTGARFLLLSNMRGHLADMDRLSDIIRRHSMILIEDCAHTMGAAWNSRKSGSFGLAGCFSTQTYKHLNSGEGGLLTSDDPDFMARAIVLSGSYMLYERHGAAPPPEVFDRIRLETPNMSGRMDNLRAAILLPQLARLEDSIARWNERYRTVEEGLKSVEGLVLPRRPEAERYVGSSIQFRLPGLSRSGADAFVAACKALGVELKWFGASDPVGFTSTHHSWRYVDPQVLPETDHVLSTLFDMRLPLTFTLEECRHIASIIAHCAHGLPPPAA
ncbi:MAG: aminotransferase class I/II-fold pyridoxal phosphate-dependent enzyme [Hoeflea sp.]|uniref:DegT/DnrJ/EryC1/StrS family aminotransferase n=1 Tax=Hoeflea sp. TaxID=1940281 RepID=UPI001DF7F581|nr:aminotransferase class I/II-fold pyridoxal phosphate-dependent enzyme [Hoeflea sp.]MBU4531733.1 aminotransferase class I/II-fold pyridoxal phosphate-dependent enzyme [Alphaproteobacteria bacterium]MBU4544589.1 aminotransferase class I/II-fold pyridoxal phosphate-dependent enzyme [Alphaproteobacteria bacterium]MBU4552820.1 aminotransferase class I/II-fold pyridoxal phosphate-dependent enzyme [Alphaproteobacteria bacterium]MBV1725009.1 aminotransferase class I/II-fold pyridoxal phosphate-depen